jgi:hypothetical protein
VLVHVLDGLPRFLNFGHNGFLPNPLHFIHCDPVVARYIVSPLNLLHAMLNSALDGDERSASRFRYFSPAQIGQQVL